MDPEVEGDGETNWEISTDMYTPPRVKQMASGKLPTAQELRPAL